METEASVLLCSLGEFGLVVQYMNHFSTWAEPEPSVAAAETVERPAADGETGGGPS